ncbi:MAG: protein kinase domain-containing protein [Chthoniobacterales bacterium]
MARNSDEYDRLQEIFLAAVDLPKKEQSVYLESECGDDARLREEVESLIAADSQTDGFTEQIDSAIPGDVFPDAPIDLGQQFGAYRILRELGRGGLGMVYLAERADDEYRKEVALKLVRRGLDTEDILERFRHERQILAQLDHPNIARLIDGGTTGEGLPYFVMEFVEGVTLTQYCARHQLDTNERLKLFCKVCEAVSYAHQNLVIHRDLKPSNILVTEEGAPKLLDFGIAKVLTSDEEAAFTQAISALRVMTPEYASPEQIKGDKITTSSDVYSLGVLLYELLTGQKPYRLTSRSVEEISRAIAEQEPIRPSRAIAEGKNSEFDLRISKFLQRDLDNIVLMALRKEPERRYATVESFSEDIRRQLNGLPVSAHQDSFQYRAAKFVRRNKIGVTAALLVLLAVLGGVGATLWEAGVADAQRAKAERRFNEVRKLANSNLFEVYPKIANLAGSLEAQQAVLLNVLQYLDSLSREATGDLELQSELATAYEKVGDVQGGRHDQSLGNYKTGLETYLKAQQLREAVSLANPEDLKAKEKLANNYSSTAKSLWYAERTKEAEATYEKGIKLRRELVAAMPDSVEANNGLATMLIDAGAIPQYNYQATEALVYFNEALGIIQKMRKKFPESRNLSKTLALDLRYLGKAKTALEKYDEALGHFQQSEVISRNLARQFPQDFRLQRDVWQSEKQICQFFINKGDGAGAVPACLKTTEFPRVALKKEPGNAAVRYDLSVSHWDVARAFALAKNYPGAIGEADKAIATISELITKLPENGEYKRYLAIYLVAKSESLIELRQFDHALAGLRRTRELLLRLLEVDRESSINQYDLARAYEMSAKAHVGKGEKVKAIESMDKAIEIVQRLGKAGALTGSDKALPAELKQEKRRMEQDLSGPDA